MWINYRFRTIHWMIAAELCTRLAKYFKGEIIFFSKLIFTFFRKKLHCCDNSYEKAYTHRSVDLIFYKHLNREAY